MKADIFFFVATLVVVAFATIGIIALFYVVKILRDIQRISRSVSKEGEKMVNDIDEMRMALKEKGGRAGNAFQNAVKSWLKRNFAPQDRSKD